MTWCLMRATVSRTTPAASAPTPTSSKCSTRPLPTSASARRITAPSARPASWNCSCRSWWARSRSAKIPARPARPRAWQRNPSPSAPNTGVTAAQYGNGGTTNTIPQGTAGQLTQLQGGNPDLSPENGGHLHAGPHRAAAGPARIHRQHRLLQHQAHGRGRRAGCQRHHAQLPGYRRPDVLQPAQAPSRSMARSMAPAWRAAATSCRPTSTSAPTSWKASTCRPRTSWSVGDLGTIRLNLNGAYQLTNDSTPIPAAAPTIAPACSGPPARLSTRCGGITSALPGTCPAT